MVQTLELRWAMNLCSFCSTWRQRKSTSLINLLKRCNMSINASRHPHEQAGRQVAPHGHSQDTFGKKKRVRRG